MEIQVMKQRLDGSTRDVVSFSSVNFDEEFSWVVRNGQVFGPWEYLDVWRINKISIVVKIRIHARAQINK